MQDLTDEELLKNIQDFTHPHEAFSELVTRHAVKFYGIAYRLLENRQDAEDVVQTCFMRLWHNPEQWDAGRGTAFTTWFTRIVLNECRMQYRKKQRNAAAPNFVSAVHVGGPMDQLSQADIAATGEDSAAQSGAYDEQMEHEQRLMRIEDAVQKLPDRQKEALILCFYEGVSNKDAAEIMDVGVKALESLLMRAKQHIKEYLHDYIHAE